MASPASTHHDANAWRPLGVGIVLIAAVLLLGAFAFERLPAPIPMPPLPAGVDGPTAQRLRSFTEVVRYRVGMSRTAAGLDDEWTQVDRQLADLRARHQGSTADLLLPMLMPIRQVSDEKRAQFAPSS